MATVDLPVSRPVSRPSWDAAGRLRARLGGGGAGRPLTGGLLAVVLYAVFDHGAVSTSAGARLEVVLAAAAALTAGGVLWTRRLRFTASRTGGVGIGVFAALVSWSGISLAWSVAPDATWLEFNRDLAYLVVLMLGVVVGASARRAPERLVTGLLWVTGIVSFYAVAQKLFPEVRLGWLLNLDRAGAIPRLEEPIGYWNALGLFVALGIPAALLRAVERERRPGSRIAHLSLCSLMVVTLLFTLSRGALLALVVALALTLPLAGPWLRSLPWLALSAGAAAPAVVLGLADHALSAANVPLSSRAGAGALLCGVLLVSLAWAGLVARRLMRAEAELQLSPVSLRQVRLGLAALPVLVILAVVVALAVSSRGLGGEVSHMWSSFTTAHAANVYDPQHLLSDDSENRWVWWQEAAGAFSARPLQGWGAGSFAAVDRLYRRDLLTVGQPHSLPLQFLSDTGLVGGLLALAAFVLLLTAATRRVRATPAGAGRLAAAALLAGAVAFLVQSLYDWDWDIPAMTLPALLLLGVLVGNPPADPARAPTEPDGSPSPRPLPGRHALHLPPPPLRPRPVAVLVTSLACAVVALSAALPSLAAGQADRALVLAGGGASHLTAAESAAELADSLDPISDAGLKVQATIAIRLGQLTVAQAELERAVAREPSDVAAWRELASVELFLDDVRGAVAAANRAVALDPLSFTANSQAFQTAQIRGLLLTPPADSATAIPIPAGTSQAPAPSRPSPSRAASAYGKVTLPAAAQTAPATTPSPSTGGASSTAGASAPAAPVTLPASSSSGKPRQGGGRTTTAKTTSSSTTTSPSSTTTSPSSGGTPPGPPVPAPPPAPDPLGGGTPPGH